MTRLWLLSYAPDLRHQVWDPPPPPFSRILDNNRRFWGMIKHPLLNKTLFFVRCIRWSTLFVKARIIVSNLKHFLCTSYRRYGQPTLRISSMLWPNGNPDENMQQHAKFLPCFIISPEKLPLLLGFANLRIPLKKYSLFRENGYEHVCMLGGGWVWGGSGTCICFTNCKYLCKIYKTQKHI